MNNADIYKAFCEVDDELLLRSEESGRQNITHFKRSIVAIIAAVMLVLVIMGAAVVKYYDSIQGWLEHTWEYATGREMSDGQSKLIDSLSQEIGISQTVDGVTVTVDSATVGEESAFLLMRFEGLETSESFMDNFALNIETSPMTVAGYGVEYRDLPDGSVIAIIRLSLQNDMAWESVDRISVKLTMSDAVEIIDNRTFVGEAKWRFSFDLYPETLETIPLPDTQVIAKKLLRNDSEETEIPVTITNAELTSIGFSCKYEFEYETVDEIEVSLMSFYDREYFVAVMEDGSEIGCGEGKHVSWRDGTAYVSSNASWIVPINLDEVVEIRIGDTVIPVK